jgi:hypothetical protein
MLINRHPNPTRFSETSPDVDDDRARRGRVPSLISPARLSGLETITSAIPIID